LIPIEDIEDEQQREEVVEEETSTPFLRQQSDPNPNPISSIALMKAASDRGAAMNGWAG